MAGPNGPRIGIKAVPKAAPVLIFVNPELMAEPANLSLEDISDLSRPLVIALSSCPATNGAPKAKAKLLPTFPTPSLNFPNFNWAACNLVGLGGPRGTAAGPAAAGAAALCAATFSACAWATNCFLNSFCSLLFKLNVESKIFTWALICLFVIVNASIVFK